MVWSGKAGLALASDGKIIVAQSASDTCRGGVIAFPTFCTHHEPAALEAAFFSASFTA